VSGSKLDVVILDAQTGKQLAQVTYDGFSWAPVWAPSGDDLVYMHLSSTVVDLYMTHVNRFGTAFTFQPEPNLTDYSGLEGDSRVAWTMPTAAAASSASASAPASASAGQSGVPSASPTAGVS
jgi:Tol biopolymer transport system component